MWLINNPDSGISRALRGHNWTIDSYLLAQIADAAATGAAMSAAFAGAEMRDFELLHTIKRPDDEEEETKFATGQEILNFQRSLMGGAHGQ